MMTIREWWGRWRHRNDIYDWAESDPSLLHPRETHVRLLNRWPERSTLKTSHARHARRS